MYGKYIMYKLIHSNQLLYLPGPSCSKLTMSLVNVSLKFRSLNMAYTLIFLLKKKMWVAFASYSHFFRKNTCELNIVLTRTVQRASVAQLDAPSDWRPGGRGFNPRRGRQHSFVEIDHEIFSAVILSLPLIQEGQLSVSGERMCTILVNRLED